MLKTTFLSLSTLMLVSSQMLAAEAVYPPPPDIRPIGLQQGSTGSCMSQAQTSAMENAFRARGFAVMISSYHAHAFNWQDKPNDPEIFQSYAPDDIAIFKHFGRFVPNYMLPEDGRAFAIWGNVEPRPAVSEYGVYDPEFPSADQTGQTATWYTFAPGFSNTIGLDQLKNFVRQRQAATISLQGSIFDSGYNLNTGLLTGPWTTHPVVKDSDSRNAIKHDVAVVGFDDDLVVGPGVSRGAFIIKNSWDENAEVFSNGSDYDPKDLSASDQTDFQRMRAKINPAKNDVGYYALPYQYVTFLASQGGGGATVYGMNYQAFNDAYVKLKDRYTVRSLPFYCDETMATKWMLQSYPSLLRDVRGTDLAKKQAALQALMRLSSPHLITQANWVGLHVALVSTTAKADRTVDFYAGKYKDYYCGRPVTEFGPTSDVLSQTDFQSALDLLTKDPYGLGSWLAIYKSIYYYLGDKTNDSANRLN